MARAGFKSPLGTHVAKVSLRPFISDLRQLKIDLDGCETSSQKDYGLFDLVMRWCMCHFINMKLVSA